ncbi:MAG: hypothetical protein P8N02_00845, partial [Actinomycetota bacterium]|nr:hypothetical protein [Actinomycetota bacterium]
MTTRPDTNRLTRILRRTAFGVFLLLTLAACGSPVDVSDAAVSEAADTPVDQSIPETATDATDTPAQTVVFEEPGVPGEAPFANALDATTVETPDDVRVGPGLYGGTGEHAVCDADLLVASLAVQPDKAAAWAQAVGIESDEVADYVDDLEAEILTVDTRVTNHGYRNGAAQPFQSTLGAGTAVLVDADGSPRTRCACGNPLDAPIITPGTGDHKPTTPTTVPSQRVDDVPDTDTEAGPDEEPPVVVVASFCDVWAVVGPTMTGGPSAPGPDALAAYLTTLADGLAQLIEAAEAAEGFPADSLTDLRDYLAMIETAIAAGGVPGPGDTALRDRVEDFL